MNYEQKYKEALERAKKHHDNPNASNVRKEWIEDIFPELRESEDERIRKQLLNWFKGCKWDAIDNETLKRDDIIAWLEKQDEQKPANTVEPKFKVGDWITNVDDEGSVTIEKVVEFLGNKVKLIDTDGICMICPQSCLNHYHLWTIQDAKDGDVLVTKKGNPFLYDKNRYNNELAYYYVGLDANKELVSKSHHSMLNHFGKLSSISPATKEQRDLLFQKMKEAGYEWDAEKKELRKIEQNPAWSEEDEKMINDIDDCIKNLPIFYETIQVNGEKRTTQQFVDSVRNWLKSINSNHWKPSEQNIKDLEWCADLIKDKMGVGFHRLQVFIDEIKNL